MKVFMLDYTRNLMANMVEKKMFQETLKIKEKRLKKSIRYRCRAYKCKGTISKNE